jgi:hypothetical protein
LRIAVLGSSIGSGYAVSYADSFTGRVETQLTQACRRHVEIQTIAVDEARGPTWHTLADRVEEAVDLRPDALVLMVAPFDIMQYSAVPTQAQASRPAEPLSATLSGDTRAPGIVAWLRRRHLTESLALFGAQHFIYEDQDRYIPLYLRHKDQADFLRPPFSKVWSLRLRIADMTISRIADQARRAHLPLVVVFIPARGQAILSASKTEPKGIDPFALDQAIGEIARRNHAAFVDITQITRRTTRVADDFYAVDGHPNDSGHALIAEGLDKALVRQAPAFAACAGEGEPGRH